MHWRVCLCEVTANEITFGWCLIFCPNSAAWNLWNTQSMSTDFKPWLVPKSLASNSCRNNQWFLERKNARISPQGAKCKRLYLLTSSDWRWLRQINSLCTAIHRERKSRAFLICNLVFGNFSNRLIVCGAANLQSGVESSHNLQNAVHHQIPRRFSLIKRAWIRIITASSSSFKYWQQKCISAYRFHYSFFRKGYSHPFPKIHFLTRMMKGDNNQPIHRSFHTHG